MKSGLTAVLICEGSKFAACMEHFLTRNSDIERELKFQRNHKFDAIKYYINSLRNQKIEANEQKIQLRAFVTNEILHLNQKSTVVPDISGTSTDDIILNPVLNKHVRLL
ncbi:hypothetical protein TNCV_2290601 [Trichonephila clavipes]|uniref:Uncharacterized protein n=1 Tax=Trichonephila clavipes TaxID=2585209 RepID=A0A8X6RRD4_TRICX|nr:hypothetical protein TNCV_2290601 [Trichonephila clavipes]